MARTALTTDSTCNLSADLLDQQHIYSAPLYVIWGEDTFRDGIDLTEPEFYKRLAESSDIPKTAQVSTQDFVSLFETAREKEQADDVVCAVISSELSGTYASAMQAKAKVDFPVHVIDTRQASWALGHAVLAGAQARDDGASAEEIVRTVVDASARQKLIFTIKNLEYLHRGGRIGNARLLLGSALQVNPVLTLEDGVIESMANVRTRRRAVDQLLKFAESEVNGRPVVRLSVIHGDVESEAKSLMDCAIENLHPQETHVSYATLALGVHVGPGALGIIVEWAG